MALFSKKVLPVLKNGTLAITAILAVLVALVISFAAPGTVPAQGDRQEQRQAEDINGASQAQTDPTQTKDSPGSAHSRDSKVPSSPDTTEQGAQASSDVSDETMFYAFLEEDPRLNTGPLYKILKDRPAVRELVFPSNHLHRKFQPMAQWRRWADRHQQFPSALFFLCLTGFLSWSLFPSLLQSAAEECKQSFWKSFGTGLLLSVIIMTLLRSVLMTGIGWPLAVVLAGIYHGILIVGLSLTMFNLGHSLSLLLQINKIPFLANRPSWLRFTDIFIGSILAALLLQIPPLGVIPRCGTRLLALFAVLGTGAIYREFKRRQTSREA